MRCVRKSSVAVPLVLVGKYVGYKTIGMISGMDFKLGSIAYYLYASILIYVENQVLLLANISCLLFHGY